MRVIRRGSVAAAVSSIVATTGLCAFTAGVASGCGDDPAAVETGLALSVAALHMPAIDAACYDVRVRGAAGVVWQQGDPAVTASDGDAKAICSDVYGSGGGGDLAYVGSCDASAEGDSDAARAGTQNEVTLWVDGLYTMAAGDYVAITSGWQNPCGAEGCTVAFDCRENEDTPVAFDFTILRQGNTGFFDIVVEFDDIFCAAKVDCRYVNETPEASDDPVIRLVRGVDGGDKLPTVVFAIACSAGAGDEGTTRLYLSDIAIDCAGDADDSLVPVDVADQVFTQDPPGVVAQADVSQGEENLVAEDKLYWGVALGLTPSDDSDPLGPVFAGKDCTLTASGTASSGDIDRALAGVNVSYPYIAAAVPLTDGDGKLVCTQHPVNGGNGLSTVYSALAGLPAEIVWEMVQAPLGRVTVGPYVPGEID